VPAVKKLWMAVLCTVLLAAIPAANAQETRPPTIFRFESDVTSVTVEQLEAGDRRPRCRGMSPTSPAITG
jgi:hypothetical protein